MSDQQIALPETNECNLPAFNHPRAGSQSSRLRALALTLSNQGWYAFSSNCRVVIVWLSPNGLAGSPSSGSPGARDPIIAMATVQDCRCKGVCRAENAIKKRENVNRQQSYSLDLYIFGSRICVATWSSTESPFYQRNRTSVKEE